MTVQFLVPFSDVTQNGIASDIIILYCYGVFKGRNQKVSLWGGRSY